MRPCCSLLQHLLLKVLWKPDIAVSVSVNMHEHAPSDKERVLVNAGVLVLRHTGQRENPSPQLFMNFRSGDHGPMPSSQAGAGRPFPCPDTSRSDPSIPA